MTNGEPRYNPIFTRFVDLEGDEDNIKGLVAYGLYKIAKREWAREIWAAHGRKPTEDELDSYTLTWTDSQLRGVQEQAETALGRFAVSVVEASTPDIREDALRGTFWPAVGQSIQ